MSEEEETKKKKKRKKKQREKKERENAKEKTKCVEPVCNGKKSASAAVREEHVRPWRCEQKSVLSRQCGVS